MVKAFLIAGSVACYPGEASYRCMLEMSSVQPVYLEAELLEGDAKEHLCSSGPISLRDEDWVCLSTTETASGDLFKWPCSIWSVGRSDQ